MVHPARPARRASALVALTVGCLLALSASAQEKTPAQRSQELAQEGAGHFKAKEYLQAARKFEEAYRLSPTNPVMLRYSGRGWQEVGHWERARQLLERYYQIEKDPNNKATILKHLGELRGATPLVIATRLQFATETYPGQGLELDAGFAFEKLGALECKKGNGDAGVKALRQAKQFFEVARLGVKTPAERAEISTAVQRVEGKVDKCKPFCAEKLDGPWCADDKTLITCVGRKAKETKMCTRCTSGGPGQPGRCMTATGPGPSGPQDPPPKGSSGLVKYIIGGALLAIGGGAAGLGIMSSGNADTDYKNDAKTADKSAWVFATYDDYKDAKSTAGTMQAVGIATAVVGAGVLAWGVLSSGGHTEPAKKSSWLVPTIGPNTVGFGFGGRF